MHANLLSSKEISDVAGGGTCRCMTILGSKLRGMVDMPDAENPEQCATKCCARTLNWREWVWYDDQDNVESKGICAASKKIVSKVFNLDKVKIVDGC